MLIDLKRIFETVNHTASRKGRKVTKCIMSKGINDELMYQMGEVGTDMSLFGIERAVEDEEIFMRFITVKKEGQVSNIFNQDARYILKKNLPIAFPGTPVIFSLNSPVPIIKLVDGNIRWCVQDENVIKSLIDYGWVEEVKEQKPLLEGILVFHKNIDSISFFSSTEEIPETCKKYNCKYYKMREIK